MKKKYFGISARRAEGAGWNCVPPEAAICGKWKKDFQPAGFGPVQRTIRFSRRVISWYSIVDSRHRITIDMTSRSILKSCVHILIQLGIVL